MTFKANYPIRSKVVLENKIVGQISNFKNLGCRVSFRDDNGI